MKEKANYPKNTTTKNTKKNKIDHFLAFRRKAKKSTIRPSRWPKVDDFRTIFRTIKKPDFWKPNDFFYFIVKS